jgi:hypothetical protein
MAAGEIHVGDIGLVFLVTIQDDLGPLDVSQATSIQFLFLRPDGTVFGVPAQFNTNGTDGKVFYSTVIDDLSIPGTWMQQVRIAIGGALKNSDIGKFSVIANLD